MSAKYTIVTEVPGVMASKEQLARLFQRYHFAAQFCSGKDVLELACDAGQIMDNIGLFGWHLKKRM